MMAETKVGDPAVAPILRLQEAINRHDLEALVERFTEDYAVEMPVHPARSFQGSAQVRRNWEQILAGVPDLRAELVAIAVDGGTVWAEWDWSGTRVDGAAHHLRGTSILGLPGDRIAWSRFYLEPVEVEGPAIDAAIRASLSAAERAG
jgi:ketosteroid isomerase-like protein